MYYGYLNILIYNVDIIDMDLRRYLCFLNNDKSVNWDANSKGYIDYQS